MRGDEPSRDRVAALRAQLRRLELLEQDSEVYREMLARAEVRRREAKEAPRSTAQVWV